MIKADYAKIEVNGSGMILKTEMVCIMEALLKHKVVNKEELLEMVDYACKPKSEHEEEINKFFSDMDEDQMKQILESIITAFGK